jgi:DNA-directed RNA polymerase subunit RPC12/RpoP
MGTAMPLFQRGEKLKCPYKGCGKTFAKPAVITDTSTIVRETFYACPHCMSKIEVVVEGNRIVEVRPVDYPKVFESPAKCAHHFGFLSTIPREGPLPDECLVCPKVLQCTIRKR